MLEVSNRADQLFRAAVESARTGARGKRPTPAQAAQRARSHCILDVSYAGSPLVAGQLGPGVQPPPRPGPGDRYLDRTALTGTAHHLLLFGAADDAGAARLRRRWHGLVEVVYATGDPRRPACPGAGAVLIRPDGHLGFAPRPRTLQDSPRSTPTYLVPA